MAYTPKEAPTVTTPAAVIQYLQEVDGEIRALQVDMANAVSSGAVKAADWGPQRDAFVQQWTAFRDSYLDVGWLVILPGDAWNRVAQYQAKNEAWREVFVARGGKPISPGPRPLREPTSVVNSLILLGLVGLGALLVWELK